MKRTVEKKKKEKRKEEKEELKKLRNTAEVWKYINKRRRERSWEDNNISNKKWEAYFENLLKGAV